MEAVIGATVKFVLQNVLSAIQEVNIGSGYEDDLTRLNRSIVMIQKYVSDAEKNKVSREAVHEWLKQLEDMAFEADAVLDEIKYESLRRQVNKQNLGSKKVMEFFSSGPSKFIFKVKMSNKIKDIINKLETINKEARGYSLPTAIAVANQTSVEFSSVSTYNERETDSFSVEPYVIGRENYVLGIVEKLIRAPSQETLSVIAIVGMGGVGKTTVARTVFNDKLIKNHFVEKIRLSVSFNFDALSLFKKILEALTEEEVKVTCKEVALLKIQKLLADKKYLLVLDDVWNEKCDEWDEFMKPLSTISNVNGNCIVVTTRNENVISHVRTLSTYQLCGLNKSHCWSIIKAETFKEMDVPEEFERVGKHIAGRCGGLPLAAKVVGGLLRGKTYEEWWNILENKLLDDGGNKIKKILWLSYDNLPSIPLKKCFAYCSFFDKSFTFSKQQLIVLWMAEGFLQADKGNDMETVGSKIFNHLLQHSLFQDAKRDFWGEIVYCKMHDLVHDLACSITNNMHQVRYLMARNESIPISRGQMIYLRTLIYFGRMAINMFTDFKRLHVLILVGMEITELPTVIEKLIHLRSLDVSLTKVELLPDSIGNLYHLQTLTIANVHHWTTNLKLLPDTTIKLVNLRHLFISPVTELPPGIGKLTSLQSLHQYRVRDKNGHRIGELRNLKNLKGELVIKDLEMVKDKEEAEFVDLYRKSGILKLILMWSESSDDARQHENVLEGLQPHLRLESLKIIGYKGKTLPPWTMRMAAPACINIEIQAYNSLVEIKLIGFTQCEELPTLGHLRRLRFLVLERLCGVRRIGLPFYALEDCSINKVAFPALERIYLICMPELTEWLGAEGAITVFPCLKFLEIRRCRKLNSVHTHLPCLEILIVDNVDAGFFSTNFCSNTGSLFRIEIRCISRLIYLPAELFMENKHLTHLNIRNCRKLTRLVPSSLGAGTSLKILQIVNCQNLTELPQDLNTLCKLEEFWIIHCPELKSIPYDARGQSQGLSSLRILNIRECKGLMDLPIELLESCISSLEKLSLWNLENLENMDTLIPCLGRMPRLQNLIVAEIPKLMNFPMEIGCIGSLQMLTMGGFSESINAASFNDGITTILNKCSIKGLYLSGRKHWDSLPDSIQNLIDPQTIYLKDYGIEYIPEWIGKFSSLRNLAFYDCKRLRHLPSKEAMKRLTRLHTLRIGGCPLLKESCSPQNTQHDSEWPKISHIRTVIVDGNRLPTKYVGNNKEDI